MEITSMLISSENLTTLSLFIDGFSPVNLIDFEPVTATNHPKNEPIGYWDYSLILLTENQRIILTVVVIILLAYAVFGNCATIYVNIFRKRRPFFRVCLLSLAFSDLFISIFQSASYIAQFSNAETVVWRLGEIMCGLIPFMTTTGILVNSMTLVGIALDRYMAVKKAIKGTWEPGSVFCGTCVVLVWGLAAGIASPMMTSYFIYEVFVLISDPENRTNAINLTTSEMCVGEKSENGYYFGIVFAIVFIPLLVAFSWLNMTIAKEIYNRRHPVITNSNQTASRNNNSNRTTTDDTSLDKRTGETDTTDDDKTNKMAKAKKSAPKSSKKIGDTRKIRQLRMFIVIIVIITLFLLLRLPTWIFLLLKMNLTFTENYHWLLNYSFGILSLTSCVVNPFLYTFLSETLVYGARLTKAFKNCCFFLFCGVCCGARVLTSEIPDSRPDIRHIKRDTPIGCVDSQSKSSECSEQEVKFSRVVEMVTDIDQCDADGGIYKGVDNNLK